MNEVFADSFYWIALLNPADAFHQTVVGTPVSGRIVTNSCGAGPGKSQ